MNRCEYCCFAVLLLAPAAFAELESISAASPRLIDAEIGNVTIINRNIFDLDDPEENRALYRFANTVHIRTRPDVIESQLLFESGELYDAQKLAESERLLRKSRYLGSAEIIPVKLEDGVVDLEVRTTDDWTLKPSLSFGRRGGHNKSEIGIEEHNLFGFGSQISLEFKSDVDRDSTALSYADNNLFGSRYALDADYANNSDGFWRRVRIGKPFYALGSTRANGFLMSSGRQIETHYDLGKAVSEYDHAFRRHEAFVGWSSGLQNKWTRRWTTGVVYDEHNFYAPLNGELPVAAIPEARQFVYPFVGIEFLEDEFIKDRNVDQIGRVEDRHLGANMSLRVGYSSAQNGSTADALHIDALYGNTIRPGKKSTLHLGASLTGRYEQGTARNVLLSLGSRYDRRQSEHRLLHARITANVGDKLDADNPLYLGGQSGLRGYPLRYQAGDKSVLLTLEQRIFTEWYPFRLFRVGGAVFFDAGRTWGGAPRGNRNLGWLRDVGFGLRIGNSRSSVGRVLHLDLAFPLDGTSDISNVQLQLEAKRSF